MRDPSRTWFLLIPVSLLLALMAIASYGPAQQPIKDINATPLQLWQSTDPSPARPSYLPEQQFLRLGGWTYFRGNTPVTGAELFRTNGAKTELVLDLYPGADGSNPADLTHIGGKLYFSAEEPLHGRELWLSDGTAKGTRILHDFVDGPESSNPQGPTGLSNGRILCSLWSSSSRGLWVTDGTTAGTREIGKSIIPSGAGETTVVNDGSLAYFHYTGGIWVTDGTTQGTQRVLLATTPTSGGHLRAIGVSGILIELIGRNARHEIWVVAGAGKKPAHILTLPWFDPSTTRGLRSSVAYKGRVYFFLDAQRLYSTDGTPIGTTILYRAPGNETLSNLTIGGKSILFTVEAPLQHRCAIYFSDGTPKGTRYWVAVPANDPGSLCSTGGKVFLRGRAPSTGLELWVSDGTMVGTFLVSDILAGSKSSYPSSITEVATGQILFSADDGSGKSRREPWISKGTAKSTQLMDLKPWSKILDTADDRVHGIVGLFGKVLFSADDGNAGSELWCSDGTAKGTVLVKDILPGPKGGLNSSRLFRFRDRVLFGADDGVQGNELWISDGTSAGTRMIKNIAYGRNSSWPRGFVSAKGKVFFITGSITGRLELWGSDGTTMGTKFVLRLPLYAQRPQLAVLADGRCLLSFLDPQDNGFAVLWVSDGTGQGTKKLRVLPSHAGHLWKPLDLHSLGNRAFFAAGGAKTGTELWVSDGTTNGTTLLLNIASDGQQMTSSSPRDFFTRGGFVYFQAYSKAHGRALWVSDGTVIGTRYHSSLGVFDGSIFHTKVGSRYHYFSARDARGLRNLASMDLQDQVRFFSGINATGNSSPSNQVDGDSAFAVEDGAIWFAATKYGHDRQLYALREHAVAQSVGQAMASTIVSSTDPVQGKTVTIEAETRMTKPILLLLLGLPARKPLSIPPFYLLHYDLTAFALPVGIGLGNRLNVGLPIPPDKSLTGAKTILQAWSLDPRRFPQGLELSNAVHWTLGR